MSKIKYIAGHLREIYRGYLWPSVTYLASYSAGTGFETHSSWRHVRWFALIITIIAVQVTVSKINKDPKP